MRLDWDKIGEREYETGIDHGVLYPVVNNTYPVGVAWSGLTSVSESPSGGESNAVYADNIKYLTLISAEEFGGTIEAFMYPDEWAQCDGSAVTNGGVTLEQQSRRSFGLSYRTLIGNDTEDTDYGYKIHLVYGAKASPSEKSRSTVNDSPEATQFSWEFSTIPIVLKTVNPDTGKVYKPTSHIILDSTKISAAKLQAFEDILYGTDNTEARLPMPDDVIAFFEGSDNPLEALTVDASVSDSVDLFGKVASDLQSNIVISGNTISGTLKYISDYTGFSSKTEEQKGNYIAIHSAVPGVADAKITVTVTKPSVLDEDGIAVLKIADSNTQTITVKASKDGYADVSKVFTLKGLTLETA